jgi:diguanylate cyclase (GGDEF)-like protein
MGTGNGAHAPRWRDFGERHLGERDLGERAQYRAGSAAHTPRMSRRDPRPPVRLLAPALVLACLLCLLAGAGAALAETLNGTPLLRRYLPEDYNATPQHWAIASDKAGRLFVGNAEGVLRYDGEQWQLVPLPGKQVARELVTGRDGRIYVGSYDTFGWLREDDDGEIVYQELMTAAGLKGRERNVGNVWQVVVADAGVYFRTERALHFLSYDRKRVAHWPLEENQRSMYAQGDTLFARIDGVGFSRFHDGKYTLEPGGELFADQILAGVLDREGWRLLVGDEGFYRADAAGIRPLPDGAGGELRGKHGYTVLGLGDGSFVVGTLAGEVFRYGPDFRLRNRVSLGSFGITALGADREGGLWAATEGDLVRMSLPSPWSFIGSAQGLTGTVFDFEWHDGALWLATSRGVQRMRPGPDGGIAAEETGWVELEAYALAGDAHGLVIAHRNGLMVLDPGAATPRTLVETESEAALELLASPRTPGRMYALGDQRLFVLERDGERWGLAFSLPLDGASAAGLLETGPDEVWFSDSRGGPQRWTLDVVNHRLSARQVFGAKQGLELPEGVGSTVYQLDGRVHVVVGERGYRFDSGRFVPDAGPPFTLVDRPDELIVEQTPLGTYAFTRRQLWQRTGTPGTWKPLHLGSALASGYGRLRYNADKVLRVATWSGLLQFDPSEKQPEPAPLALGFDIVTAESPDGQQTLRLPVSAQSTPVEIPSGYRLHFRYGMVSMDSGVEYRYLLHGEGLPREWSAWTDRDLFIRALTHGDYLLQVEARTRSGRTAAPTSYRYRILPRWHERLWVRGLAGLVLLGIGALLVQEFVRRRTQRYVEANRKLEARIGERTHELEAVNRKLAELATEDALTGVANRRALENGLQREWYRCLDQRRPLSVMMIDVDHFKRYNDAHGHLEGDILLRSIAQRLHALHDPKRELLARYGGEEFALLLPGVHQDESQRRAEKIRVAMAEHIGDTTISIGVAGFVPSMQADSMTLLRRADAALYRAKRGGRNRVEADADATA